MPERRLSLSLSMFLCNLGTRRTSGRRGGTAHSGQSSLGISGRRSRGQQDTSHNIQEATPEEIKAAEQKKAAEKDSHVASQEEPDDGEYLQALWDSAKETAKSDPNRPRSAAELVTSGNLKPWWNMSWREVTPYFPETAGYQAFLKEAGQETPPLVINRLSTVLAAFRHFQRPLEGDSPMAHQVGPELLRFEVPGQQIIVLACRISFSGV